MKTLLIILFIAAFPLYQAISVKKFQRICTIEQQLKHLINNRIAASCDFQCSLKNLNMQEKTLTCATEDSFSNKTIDSLKFQMYFYNDMKTLIELSGRKTDYYTCLTEQSPSLENLPMNDYSYCVKCEAQSSIDNVSTVGLQISCNGLNRFEYTKKTTIILECQTEKEQGEIFENAVILHFPYVVDWTDRISRMVIKVAFTISNKMELSDIKQSFILTYCDKASANDEHNLHVDPFWSFIAHLFLLAFQYSI